MVIHFHSGCVFLFFFIGLQPLLVPGYFHNSPRSPFPLLTTHKSGHRPFKHHHTAPRSFQLHANAGAGAAAMFRDDSSEAMTLFDNYCSATVLRRASFLNIWHRCSSVLKLSCFWLSEPEARVDWGAQTFGTRKRFHQVLTESFMTRPRGAAWKIY